MTAVAAQACPPAPATPGPADGPTDKIHPRDLQLVTTDDGITLSVHDSSPAAATRTVLFLHGLYLSRTTWTQQVARIREDYGSSVRVTACDHRGHGLSVHAPISTYTIDQLADDLAHLLTALDVPVPLTLVAHSRDAMTAFAYLSRPTAQRSIDSSGLVLVAAAGKPSQRGFGRLLALPATTALTRPAAHALKAVLRGLVAPLCATPSPIRDRLPAGTIASVTIPALSTTAAPTAVGSLPSLRIYDLSQTLGAVRACTVVASGGARFLDPIRAFARAVRRPPPSTYPTQATLLPQQAPMSSTTLSRAASGLDAGTQVPAQSTHQIRPGQARSQQRHHGCLTSVG